MGSHFWFIVALLVILMQLLCVPVEHRAAWLRKEVTSILWSCFVAVPVIGLFYGGMYVWATGYAEYVGIALLIIVGCWLLGVLNKKIFPKPQCETWAEFHERTNRLGEFSGKELRSITKERREAGL